MQLTLHMTEQCNMRCRYCFAGDKVGPKMTLDTAIAAYNLAVKRGDPELSVTFFGGEPLLCKDTIMEVVKAYKLQPEVRAGKVRLSFNMTTNGTLLDTEFVAFAKKHNIFITLSIDGVREAHDVDRVYTGGAGTFDHTLRAFDMLKEGLPGFATWSVITPFNAGRLAESVQFLFERGSRILILAMDTSHSEWTWDHFKTLEKSYKKVADWYVNTTLANKYFYMAPFDRKIELHTKGDTCDRACQIGISSVSVDPSGTLYPCQTFVNQTVDFSIGNVETGLDLKRRNDFYQESQKDRPDCNGCAVRDRCNHKCSCLTWSATRTLNGISPLVCEHERLLVRVADSIGRRLYKKRNPLFLHKQYNKHFNMMRILEDIILKEKEDMLIAGHGK